jgi:hypothetical protein
VYMLARARVRCAFLRLALLVSARACLSHLMEIHLWVAEQKYISRSASNLSKFFISSKQIVDATPTNIVTPVHIEHRIKIRL